MTPPYQQPDDGLARYEITDAAIVEFLAQRPALKTYLLATYDELRAYFPVATFALELVTDPTPKGIFIYIKTIKSVDEAMRILGDFNQAWWLPNLPEFAGQLWLGLDIM